MTDTTIHTPSRSRFALLRQALRANAGFSGLSGLALLLGARPLAAFIGVEPAGILAGIGAVLILYAAVLFWISRQPAIDRRFGLLAVGLDLLWVLGSVALLLLPNTPFTTAGKWTIGLLAEIVFWFAVWQAYALRKDNAAFVLQS